MKELHFYKLAAQSLIIEDKVRQYVAIFKEPKNLVMLRITYTRILSALCAVLTSGILYAQPASTSEADFNVHHKHVSIVQDSSNYFGHAVALAGDVAVVSDAEGHVEVLRQGADGTWAFEALLTADMPDIDFGGEHAVATNGTYIAVGAKSDDTFDANSGAVYLYKYDGLDWQSAGVLDHMNPFGNADSDFFGISLAMDGDHLVVGSKMENGHGAQGCVTYFEYNTLLDMWLEAGVVQSTHTTGGCISLFAGSVDVDGDHMIVGEPRNSENDLDAGAAHIYRFENYCWHHQGTFYGDEQDRLGTDVAISGDRAAAGAPFASGDDNVQGGKVAIYQNLDFSSNSAMWTETHYFQASAVVSWDRFGYSVDLDGDVLAVGAPTDDQMNLNAGLGYFIYDCSTEILECVSEAFACDAMPDDRFGYAVAVDGGIVLVGTKRDDNIFPDAGSAYFLGADDQGFACDLTGPAAPLVDLLAADDSGVSDSDNITQHNTLNLMGLFNLNDAMTAQELTHPGDALKWWIQGSTDTSIFVLNEVDIEMGHGDVNYFEAPFADGEYTFCGRMVDIYGNQSADDCLLVIIDNENPAVVVADFNAYLDEDGEVTITADDADNGTTDNVGLDELTLSQYDFACADLGPNPVTFTAVDLAGNSDSEDLTVTVIDDLSPILSLQDIHLYLDDNGAASTTAEAIDNGSTDNCSIVSISISETDFGCNDLSPAGNEIDFTATDQSDNSATTQATVFVHDTISPTMAAQDITLYLSAAGNVAVSAAEVDNGSFDNCEVELSLSVSGFGCANVGENEVTLSGVDPSGNESTATATVTVQDNIAPVAIAQDITVQLDAMGAASITASQINNGSSDACGIASLSISPSWFGCANVGDNTVTLTVTDNNGNLSLAQATITVMDEIDPVVLAQDVTVQLDANGAGSVTAVQIDNGSGDNCGIASLLLEVDGGSFVESLSFDCSHVGSNEVTILATDVNGNEGEAMVTVTVEDNTAPTIDAVEESVVYLDALGDVSLVDDSIVEVNDACGVETVEYDASSINCEHAGFSSTDSVLYFIEDDDNGILFYDTENQSGITVYYDDLEAFPGQAHVILYDEMLGGYLISDGGNDGFLDVAIVNGNNFTITEEYNDISTEDGLFWSNDMGLIGMDAYDYANGMHYGIIEDDDTWDEGLDTDVEAGETPLFTFEFTSPTTISTTLIAMLPSNPVGCAQDYNWNSLAIDEENNIAYIVGDEVIGECFDEVDEFLYSFDLSTLELTYIGHLDDDVQALWHDGDQLWAGFDNGQIGVIHPGVTSPHETYGTSADYTIYNDYQADDLQAVIEGPAPNYGTVTVTATDINGNESTADISVVVLDTIAPEALAQDVIVQLNDTGNGSTTPELVDNGSSDACGIASLALSQTEFDCTHVGANAVTLTVTDNSGNESTATATVTVEDNIAPVASAQNVTVQLDEDGNGSTTAELVNDGSSDNCGILSLALSQTDFDCSHVGDNAVTLTVTDVNGNESTATATVTVEDNESPHPEASDLDVYLDDQGMASITALQVNAGSWDNCAVDTIWLDQYDFDCDEVGLNSIEITVLDVNGNQASALTDITVHDMVSPEALAADFTLELDENGAGTITPADIDAGSNDACGIFSLALSQTEFNCLHVGDDNEVTLTVTDENGNESTATATVTVEDNTAPVIVPNDITIYLDDSGYAGCEACDLGSSSSDACGATLTASQVEFDCSETGENTVVLTAEDPSGNISTDVAIVTVLDAINPTALTQDVTISLDANGEASITPDQIDDGSNDNCLNVALSLDNSSFDCSNLGTNTVTLTVTDDSGNASTATATVTVEDIINPEISASGVNIYLDENGVGSLSVDGAVSGVTDNCSVESLTISIDGSDPASSVDFDCDDVGEEITATITATDVSGNFVTATAEVMVVDTMNPITAVQDYTLILDADGDGSIVVADINNGSSDNCGFDMSLDITSFDCSNVGLNDVTLTSTDDSGNSSFAVAVVTVVDDMEPITAVQNYTLDLDADGNGSIVVADINNGSSDNCGFDMSLDITSFDCSNVGLNDVTLTSTDDSGNSSSAVAVVTVNDNIYPTVVAADFDLVLDAMGVGSITTSDIDNGSYDNCDFEMELDVTSFNCNQVGPNQVILTVTDANDNVSWQTVTVTVIDNTNPVISVQDLTVSLDENGQATVAACDLDNGSSDACGLVLSSDLSEFDCDDVDEVQVVTLTATDSNGNFVTATAEVTVVDDMEPITAVQDYTLNLDADGNGSIVVSDIDNGSSDNCGFDMSLDITLFDCSNVGPNDVTLTSTDDSGNSTFAVAVVTVVDNTPPTTLVNNIDLVLDDEGNGSIVIADINNNSFDNCEFEMVASQLSFDCSDVGLTDVTLTSTDDSGNSTSAVAVVNVIDNISPVVEVQDLYFDLCDLDEVTLTAEDFITSSSDVCGIASQVIDLSHFTCMDNHGHNTVTITVTDNNGNATVNTADVHMDCDNTAPSCPTIDLVDAEDLGTSNTDNVTSIIDPTIQVIFTGEGLESVEAGDEVAFYVNGELWDTATVSEADSSNGYVDFETWSLDPPMTTFSAIHTDECGYSSSVAYLNIVLDTEAPVVNTQDLTLELDADGSATVTTGDIENGSTDDQPGLVIEGISAACNSYPLTTGAVDGYLSDEDDEYEWAELPFFFNYNGADYESISVSTNGTIAFWSDDYDDGYYDYPGYMLEDYGWPVIAAVNTDLDPEEGGTIHYGVVGEAPNRAYVISWNGVANFEENDIRHDAQIVLHEGSNVVEIYNGGYPSIYDDMTIGLAFGDYSGIGPVEGSTASQTPAIWTFTPSVDGYSMEEESCFGQSIAYDCGDVGENTVTLVITDFAGNQSTGDATVTVVDAMDPTAVAQNVTVHLDANGEGTVLATDMEAGSSDNCEVVDISIGEFEMSTAIGDVAASYPMNTGSIDSGLSESDDDYEYFTLPFTFTFYGRDYTEIDISTNGTISFDGWGDEYESNDFVDYGYDMVMAVHTDLDPGERDDDFIAYGVTGTAPNRAVVISWSQTPNYDYNDIRHDAQIVLYEGSNVVEIFNGGHPEIGDEMTVGIASEDYEGMGPLEYSYDAFAAGKWQFTPSGSTYVMSPMDGEEISILAGQASIQLDCSNVGTFAQDYYVIDSSDNINMTTAQVTVIDEVAPNAIAQDVTIQLDENGAASTTVDAVNNGSNDACGVASVTLSQTAFECGELGENAVTLTVTDVNGNVSTASATVTVEDLIDPVATMYAPADFAIYAGASCVNGADLYEAGSPWYEATDNCENDLEVEIAYAEVNDNGGTAGCREFDRRWIITVTDAAGNTDADTAYQHITISDVTAPEVSLEQPADVTLNLDADCSVELPAALSLATSATDNCTASPAMSAVTMSDGAATPLCEGGAGSYSILRTYSVTATDACGNATTTTVEMTITVLDVMAPQITDAEGMTNGQQVDHDADAGGILDFATMPDAATVQADDFCDPTVDVSLTQIPSGAVPTDEIANYCAPSTPEAASGNMACTGTAPNAIVLEGAFFGGEAFNIDDAGVNSIEVGYDEHLDITLTVTNGDNTGGFVWTTRYNPAWTWSEWSAEARSYKKDCADIMAGEMPWEDWSYFIMSNGSMSGTGIYAGSNLTMTHQPLNYYYGFQVGAGANNQNANYGASAWFYWSGEIVVDGVSQGQQASSGDVAMDLDCALPWSIENQYTASDDCGNSTVFTYTDAGTGEVTGEGATVSGGQGHTPYEITTGASGLKDPIRITGLMPNPTTDVATLGFVVVENMRIRIDLYTMSGVLVQGLFDGTAGANQQYLLDIDASGLGSGMYQIRISSSSYMTVKKLLVTQ